MKNFIYIRRIILLYFISTVFCFAQGVPIESISVDIRDKDSLQRGAKIYMNYCSGCHSLKYMRYNAMAEGLGLMTFDGLVDEDLLSNNLIFTKSKIYDPIQIAMSPEDAKQWFGMVPPDLSLKVRERGAAWIYTYLKSFYADAARPFGSNNLLFPDVSMPNVLEPLIGKVIMDKHADSVGGQLLVVQSGEMQPAEFDSAMRDLVTFLSYVAEPAKLTRFRMGYFVVIYFVLLAIVTYFLKEAYWKKIKKHP